MADSDSTPSLPAGSHPSVIKESTSPSPIGAKISELSETRSEILTRLQGLKYDLQSWRSKMDTQVKVYRDELLVMKKSLNVEVDQLREEFQNLRTTLQQQQEDVAVSLKNLGDVSEDANEAQNLEAKEDTQDILARAPEENDKNSEP